jgi:hypothetical protein
MTDLVRRMQRLVANSSITPSSIRGGRQAVKGVSNAAIGFLCDLDLRELSKASEFQDVLDRETQRLLDALPLGARYWGRARKCINIFLRESTYNYLLRETFSLHKLTPLLETPLDSRVAHGLKCDAAPDRVPTWTTVIAVGSNENGVYQEIAAKVAREKYGTYRVNLDLWYWRPEDNATTQT